MAEVKTILKKYKIVPVVVIENYENVELLAEILIRCNLPIAEITFRTEDAAKALNMLKKKYPQITAGAGTLTKKEDIDRAVDAGADFFVSPGFNPVNVEYALKKELNFIPGVSNPSLIEQAMEFDLKELKFFPAEISGGSSMLKTLGAVYPEVSFMPTGGINAQNIGQYLSLKNVFACGGSWFVKSDLIRNSEFDKIEILIKEAVKKTKEIF